MSEALGPWECFQDVAYYDMWCVRQVHDREFGNGFHLVSGDEAAALRDLLNTRTSEPVMDPQWTKVFNAGIDYAADAIERGDYRKD